MSPFRVALCKRVLGRCFTVVESSFQDHDRIRFLADPSSYASSSSWTFFGQPPSDQQHQHEHQYRKEGNTEYPVEGSWSDKTIRNALDKIWYHINRNKAKKAPDLSLQLVERLLEQETLQNRSIVEKGVVINALKYCQRRGVSRDESLDRLVRILEHLLQETNFQDKIPTTTTVLLAIAGCRSCKNAPERAERVLKDVVENSLELTSQNHYHAVLRGYAQRGKAKEAERLLKLMIERYASGKLADGPPGSGCYNCVIDALAKSGDPDAPKRAEAILSHLEKNPEVQPDVITYTSLLNCYAKFGMSRKAEKLLRQMQDRHAAGQLEHGPNTTSFNTVINALARSRRSDAPQCAEALLDQMIEMHSVGRNTQVHPDRITGGSILNCYAKHGKAREAYEFLRRMHDLHNVGDFKDAPTTFEYNILLNGIAKSREPDAIQRAESILEFMHEMYMSGRHEIQPDDVSYASVLHCYARKGAGKKAIELLQTMHDRHNAGELKNGPNTVSYNCAMDGLARSNDHDAPEVAKLLLYRMQLYGASLPNLQPDVITFNCLLKTFMSAGWAREAEETLQKMKEMKGEGDLKDGPSVGSYRCVIQVLANSRDRDCLLRAETLLDEIRDLPVSCPDMETLFTIVLNGYAQAGLAREAERFLSRMHGLQESGELKKAPNRISFNCVLNALAKCKEWDAPERAQALLTRMLDHPHIEPCSTTYNTLLHIYANEGMVREAEQMLQHMHELHETGILKRGPDNISYTMVLNALARRGGRQAPERATALLKRMRKICGSKPDAGTERSFLLCFDKNGKIEEGRRILDGLR